LLTVAVGCGDDADGSDLLAHGSECTDDTECASGLCEDSECATPCMDEDECPGSLACSRTHRASGTYCLPLCLKDETKEVSNAAFACIEGTYVECDDAPEDTHCEACGCDQGGYCTEDNECVPVAGEGDACTHNESCESKNCSAARFDTDIAPRDPVGECVEGPNTICTDDSACLCIPLGNQMVCATYCEDDEECDEDESCLGDLEMHIGYCHQDCSDGQACPGGQTCREYDDPSDSSRFAACNPT
jgi:hypothetical protein